MVYELKSKGYYGNAQKILEIHISAINSRDLEYLGDCMVFNMSTDDFANGSAWKHHEKLVFVTSDSMDELMKRVKSHEVLMVIK